MRAQQMTIGISNTGLFCADLAVALKDPEFREAFFNQLEEMGKDGNDES
jgi:hypothetical protein